MWATSPKEILLQALNERELKVDNSPYVSAPELIRFVFTLPAIMFT